MQYGNMQVAVDSMYQRISCNVRSLRSAPEILEIRSSLYLTIYSDSAQMRAPLNLEYLRTCTRRVLCNRWSGKLVGTLYCLEVGWYNNRVKGFDSILLQSAVLYYDIMTYGARRPICRYYICDTVKQRILQLFSVLYLHLWKTESHLYIVPITKSDITLTSVH